jgi:hypothetical protein
MKERQFYLRLLGIPAETTWVLAGESEVEEVVDTICGLVHFFTDGEDIVALDPMVWGSAAEHLRDRRAPRCGRGWPDPKFVC